MGSSQREVEFVEMLGWSYDAITCNLTIVL